MKKKMNRRTFGAAIAGAAVAPAIAAAQTTTAQPSAAPRGRMLVPDDPPFAETLEFRSQSLTPRAQPFPMQQVKLLPGSIYANAREWNRGYMSRLEADRLLYTFRVNAGLPSGAAKPLGGWEHPEDGKRSSELRGHFMGHFLSASAQLAATGDKDAGAKGEYLVAELAKCQSKLGGKYLSAFPLTWWDRLENGEPVWAPFYTIHKIMAGLFDMYRLTGNRQALQTLEGMAAWADEWTARQNYEHMQQILTVEFGGIAETLYHLSAATNEPRWGAAGDRFQKRTFLNPLASGRDELRGLHVNTHIPQAIAASVRYKLTQDSRFQDAAQYFFNEVSTARTYVTGGTSNAELWRAAPHRLAAEWKLSPNTAECCCAYNMLKLARRLYSWNPRPEYFDYYERVLLNHRIGAIQPDTGHTQYYLSLAPGAWRTFNSEDQSFWCCTGTGVEEFSKLNDSIYWRDSQGIYVNLFIPSELDWAEKGFRLRQETNYPESASTTLAVAQARPGEMTMRIRIPGWLDSAPSVKLNGKLLEASASPGSYLALRRKWKAGDRVEIAMPMRPRVETMPDDSGLQAFLYGPLVLAGDLGSEGLTEAWITGPNLRAGVAVPPVGIPEFSAKGEPESWIRPADKPLTFRTEGQKHDATLVPLNGISSRRYSVYFRVS